MIVSMIYKSAIEDGTADVLLDSANACDIAEAEGWSQKWPSSRCTESGRMVLIPPPAVLRGGMTMNDTDVRVVAAIRAFWKREGKSRIMRRSPKRPGWQPPLPTGPSGDRSIPEEVEVEDGNTAVSPSPSPCSRMGRDNG